MRICLCALTGVGNDVLDSVLGAASAADVLVLTRRDQWPFPYHPCEPLEQLCARRGVRALVDLSVTSADALAQIAAFAPDVLLVSTFHQRIPQAVVRSAKLAAANVHASLLPKYRGPTPTAWTVLHGEAETGVTFHALAEAFDAGDVFLQETVPLPRECPDGELRRRLAGLAAAMVPRFLTLAEAGLLRPTKQDEARATHFPKITAPEALTRLRSGEFPRERVALALTPYPGVGILDRRSDGVGP